MLFKIKAMSFFPSTYQRLNTHTHTHKKTHHNMAATEIKDHRPRIE